jgi:1-acyl-sn-glycerol-3-phosphate acyltransferase
VVRAVLSIFFIAGCTILGSLTAFVLRLFDRTGDLVVALARLWSRVLLAFAGVKVTVDWRAPLDKNAPYVFMANHLSTVDIWALLAIFPFRVRMIAKKQLGSIPLFGWAMRAGRFIFIDRANAISARRSIDEAKRRIRNGDKVLLFPEGTRSRDGQLGAFKKGGFHLALDAGVPIVPVAISGTRELMPPDSYLVRKGPVHVTVCPPIPTDGLSDSDRDQLLERVRGVIAQALAEAPAPGRPRVTAPVPPQATPAASRSPSS